MFSQGYTINSRVNKGCKNHHLADNAIQPSYNRPLAYSLCVQSVTEQNKSSVNSLNNVHIPSDKSSVNSSNNVHLPSAECQYGREFLAQLGK